MGIWDRGACSGSRLEQARLVVITGLEWRGRNEEGERNVTHTRTGCNASKPGGELSICGAYDSGRAENIIWNGAHILSLSNPRVGDWVRINILSPTE